MGKTKLKPHASMLKNPLEAQRGYGFGAIDAVAPSTHEEDDHLFADMLGIKHAPHTEEFQQQLQEIELFHREKSQEASEEPTEVDYTRAHIEYHYEMRRAGESHLGAETQAMAQKVHEILAELKNLIKSSKAMEMEFAEIAMTDTPSEVGNYHINFFTQVLRMIKMAVQNVQDSGTWASAAKGRSGKKGGGGYWDMFKKHGTSFGMSNERSSATSVG